MTRAALLACAIAPLFLAACASVENAPSLAPRAAERIDPRLPVPDRSATLPGDPALLAELGALRSRALQAAQQAEPALRTAASAAAASGPRGSESWIAAQQLVSAAIAARADFTAALGDLDRLLALRIRGRERLVPQDLAAAEALVAELGTIDRRQAGILDAAERQLQR